MSAFFFAQQSGKPDQLKEADVAPTKGKSIRMARALLATVVGPLLTLARPFFIVCSI